MDLRLVTASALLAMLQNFALNVPGFAEPSPEIENSSPPSAGKILLQGEVSKNSRFFAPKISDVESKLEGTSSWELILHGDVKFTPELLQRFRSSAVFSDLGDHPRHIKLYIGNILADCSDPMTVDLSLARVKLSPGAIVYFRASQTGTAIMNFHDDHRNSVKVSVGDMQIDLPPGRMVFVTDKKGRDFDELNPCSGVWYKSLYEKQVNDKTRVFMTQFSLMSAAELMPSVKRLSALRKHRGNKIAKTFAAVYLISRDRHPFRPKLHS
ncbi:MAG: hypothetical protein K2X77_03935 [Candidatus Obscuribacterales bacterium]|jgi:hypothetical protein|nr:hypothetical protein [Candidatus Obscuribacterales bacterium]